MDASLSSHSKIGILSFEGELPICVYNSLVNKGVNPYVISFKEFPTSLKANDEISLGQIGKLYKTLRSNNVTHILLAGRLVRPNLRKLRFDFTGIKTAIGIFNYLRMGDDKLLSYIISVFEQEGFTPLSINKLCPELMMPKGCLTKIEPTKEEIQSIEQGSETISLLSKADIGQSVAISGKVILAVEALEGTDEMIKRISLIAPQRRQSLPAPIFVKQAKDNQNECADLPTFGEQTVLNLIEAGFKGIALQEGKVIILNIEKVIALCDKHGMFLVGV